MCILFPESETKTQKETFRIILVFQVGCCHSKMFQSPGGPQTSWLNIKCIYFAKAERVGWKKMSFHIYFSESLKKVNARNLRFILSIYHQLMNTFSWSCWAERPNVWMNIWVWVHLSQNTMSFLTSASLWVTFSEQLWAADPSASLLVLEGGWCLVGVHIQNKLFHGEGLSLNLNLSY